MFAPRRPGCPQPSQKTSTSRGNQGLVPAPGKGRSDMGFEPPGLLLRASCSSDPFCSRGCRRGLEASCQLWH